MITRFEKKTFGRVQATLQDDGLAKCRTVAKEENVFKPLPFLKYSSDIRDLYTKRFVFQN